MLSLHSSQDRFVLAELSQDGSPKIYFHGTNYHHSQSGSDEVVICGRIDEISGKSLGADPHLAAQSLLEHLKQRETFVGVDGQYFALAIINKKLLAHRSSFCGTSLFYGASHISDSLITICRKEDRSTFSKKYLFYFVLDIPGWQFDGNLSPIDGIFRLPSNATLFAKNNAFSVEHQKQKPLFHHYNPNQSHADAGRIILDHLQRSIENDLLFIGKRHVFCELSGGLDSSFTTALVAQKRPETRAYVYSFPDQPSHQQSIVYAKSVAQKFSIPLEVVNGNDIKIPSLEADNNATNEPADFFWQGSLFGPVIRQICGEDSAIFTGFGADQILNRTSAVPINLLRQGSFLQFLKTIGAMARDTDRSTMNLAWQALLGAAPKWLMFRLMDLQIGQAYTPFLIEELGDELRHYQKNLWLKTGGAFPARWELLKLFELGDMIHRPYFGDCLAKPNLYYLAAPNVVWGGHLGATNIWQVHPFCHSRLITASFKDMSWHLIHDWSVLYKQALREAQKGILPEDLRLRKRDDFSFDGFFLRFLRKNRDDLYELARQTSPLLEDHFDLNQFDETFEQNVFGVQNIQTQKLNRFLAYGVWARQFMVQLR